MSVSFTRALGAESGVQLNPLRDNSEIPSQDISDQAFGIMMRSTRGRIDKPFKVNRGNVLSKLGNGEQIRVSALNEAWVHVVEALSNGAYEAVVQRLVTSAAAISYAVVTQGSGATFTPVVAGGVVTGVTVGGAGGTGYVTGQSLTFTGAGTGAVATIVTTDGVVTSVTVTSGGTGYTTAPTAVIANPIAVSVQSAIPVTPFLFAVKHLGCFNDGIRIDFRADEKRLGGVNVANDFITLRVKDIADTTLYEFTGSLSTTALDDYGKSAYLPDIISAQTDLVELTVGATTTISETSPAYGYNAVGLPNWFKSGNLVCFTEGGTAYTTQDYIDAAHKLQFSEYNYSYISTGGSQSFALIAQSMSLAFNTNRQLRLDIPGNLTPAAAVTFIEALNLAGNRDTAHLVHAYWAPLKTLDPTGVNGKTYIGVATLNIAFSCARNAQTNAKGFAPKNYAVAGRQYPLNRQGVIQTYTPSDQELNQLARAKINPVMFEAYSSGQLYVFRDSLTSAPVDSSSKKLISVVEMSTSLDDAITRFGKDVLQLPMDLAMKRTEAYLKSLFEGAVASDWLIPSNDLSMGGKAYKYVVQPNAIHPDDRIDVSYWLRYPGTTRQIYFTQTLSR